MAQASLSNPAYLKIRDRAEFATEAQLRDLVAYPRAAILMRQDWLLAEQRAAIAQNRQGAGKETCSTLQHLLHT